jgi:glycerol-3-phosphate acyltransferase PlsY
MQMVLKLLMAGVLAYFIGSFPTGVILSKLWGELDIRQVGSTHTGTMNVTRSVSIGAGILLFLWTLPKASSPWLSARL